MFTRLNVTLAVHVSQLFDLESTLQASSVAVAAAHD